MSCTPRSQIFGSLWSNISKPNSKILYPVNQGPRSVRIMERNRGRKSHDTLPFRTIPYTVLHLEYFAYSVVFSKMCHWESCVQYTPGGSLTKAKKVQLKFSEKLVNSWQIIKETVSQDQFVKRGRAGRLNFLVYICMYLLNFYIMCIQIILHTV